VELGAALGRVIVTHDVRTMPTHFQTFVNEQACAGMILVPTRMALDMRSKTFCCSGRPQKLRSGRTRCVDFHSDSEVAFNRHSAIPVRIT
jgi:hypothetical protein